MKLDSTLTITTVIAVCAIISPVITAIINNVHQSKIKRIEIYELAKRQALTDYITASYNYLSSQTTENKSKFFIALNNLYVYFDISDFNYHDLSSAINSYDCENHSYYSQKLISNLSKQIEKK